MSSSSGTYWEIERAVEGSGLPVRVAEDPNSSTEEQLLSAGAVVLQLERSEEHIRYTLVSGNGPITGWVTVFTDDLEMLAHVIKKPSVLPSGSTAAVEKSSSSSGKKAPRESGPKIVLGKPSLERPSFEYGKFRDPNYLSELEAHEIDVGGLKAAVRHRPEGSAKAPISVLILPGNPVLNSWHASMPLPLAMEKAFSKAGFPVVRFDWNGQGMNQFTQHPLNQMYDDKIPVAFMMYDVAKAVGERVCLCTWNYSGSLICTPMLGGMVIDKWPEVCGVVSLSFAYKQWEMVKRFANEGAGLQLKSELEGHSKLTFPAIYLFGSKDVHTPLEDVERIVRARPDKGNGAEIYVVNQEGLKQHPPEYFAMKDREDEAAYVSALWLSNLRSNIMSSESPLLGA